MDFLYLRQLCLSFLESHPNWWIHSLILPVLFFATVSLCNLDLTTHDAAADASTRDPPVAHPTTPKLAAASTTTSSTTTTPTASRPATPFYTPPPSPPPDDPDDDDMSSSDKLDPESHLLLDEPLLRLPHELLRKNFKTAQKHLERDTPTLTTTLKTIARTTATTPPAQTLSDLDSLLTKLHSYKRKVAALHDEEQKIHGAMRKRIAHLTELHTIPNLSDPRYEQWSQVRLDRLLVDYLVRAGYANSAAALAREKGIEQLTDVGVFAACTQIEKALRAGSAKEALAWCAENKQALKKQRSGLEFQLRLQQFIELVRARDFPGALAHSRKYLAGFVSSDEHFGEMQRAAGLLCSPPEERTRRYQDLYAEDRWRMLAELFVHTHHQLFSLPKDPVIQTALSAGLSALKTPSCHAQKSSRVGESVCPICSTELKELARGVPYAHHGRSAVEGEPVVLPNGRVYGRARVEELARRLGLEGRVRDPETGEEWEDAEGVVRKVFIL